MARRAVRLVGALALGLVASLAAPELALAANPALAQAESLYRAGEREMLDEDYADAIELWTQAYDTLAEAKNTSEVRHIRAVIAVNLATLQIGTWERALDPGDLVEGRKVLQAYLLQYEAAAGKRGAEDPDLNRVRRKLLEIEALLAGERRPVFDDDSDDNYDGYDGGDDWEEDKPKRTKRERNRGGGGRKVFRKYPWERFDDPLFLIEADFDGPAIQGQAEAVTTDPDTGVPTVAQVDAERHRGWGFQIGLWTRPRTMWQLGYARRIWRADAALDPYEFRSNDLSLALTTDLLALDVDWKVYPAILPFARAAYVWGRRDYIDPSSFVQVDKQKIRGFEGVVGAHVGIVFRLGDKATLMLRGGVGKPFYALWSGGDRIHLQAEFPARLRWEAGLAFGFALD